MSGSDYATMNENGKIAIAEGVVDADIIIYCEYNNNSATKRINISYDNELAIECAPKIAGESGNAIATYNSSIV